MSLQDKLGRATYDLLEVAKTRLATDLMQARTEGRVTFQSDAQMTEVLALVTASVESSFTNGVDHILSVAATEVAATTPKKSTRKTKS
jgi:hypothetical protein